MIAPDVTPAPRVCLLTESFHPIVGGGEVHARLLSEALLSRGVPVFVLTQRRPRGIPRHAEVGPIPVERVASGGHDRWGKYFMIPPVFSTLVRRKSQFDVIYVCGLRTLGIPAVLAAGLLGKHVILRAESRMEMAGRYALDRTPAPFRPLVAAALRARNRLYGHAAAFVSISEDLTAEFLEAAVPKRLITRIPNGVDTDAFRPAEPGESIGLRERLGLPLDAVIVVYTGKLNRGKGLENLLRAWTRLDSADAGPAHLVLVGGGANQFLSCEEELRAFAEANGLGPRVTFTGYVANVADYLRAADIFTLPSESESFGLSLVEAMACGLPVVVTDIGGMPEIVSDGEQGLIVPVDDEERLVGALERLLADGEARASMGRAGRRTTEERFGIGAVAEAHERLFRSVLTGDG